MVLTAFRIGDQFTMGGHTFQCTDIGSRVVVAIRMDAVVVGKLVGQPALVQAQEAKDAGWFNGPPYAVAEQVFDEYELPSCEPVHGG